MLLVGSTYRSDDLHRIIGIDRKEGYNSQESYYTDTLEQITNDDYNYRDRVVGEKSADCFNILSIDTYDKTLKLFRVGVDRDRWLRHKGTMCLKYDTRKLLWND